MSSFHQYATRSRKRKALDVPSPTIGKTTLLDLPYHIITDILLRLPAESVFQCQCASKLIEILVKTPSFTRTHRARQATSTILAVQSFPQSSQQEIRLYFSDEQTTKFKRANLKLDFRYARVDDPIMLYHSYDGFLLFKNKQHSHRSVFIIWNPTTKEQVTMLMEGFNVYGFYYNPQNKEYEVLLLYDTYTRNQNGEMVASILSLGSKLPRKYKLQRDFARYPTYMPVSERPPKIINGTLYWMVDQIVSDVEVNCSNSIVAFEIGTNKFSTIRHGGAACNDPDLDHDPMHLIEMEGKLGLCHYLRSTNKLVLWVLNPATNSWGKTHTVTLPKHSTPKYFSRFPNRLRVEVVLVKNDKLLVRQENRLLLCDLVLKTHEIVKQKGFEDDSFRPVIHTHSLVSLDTDKLIQLERG